MKKYIRNLNIGRDIRNVFLGVASAPLVIGGLMNHAQATEPCGDFGECKALIEINASDGDIGFHWLSDGDDLRWTVIRDPNNKLVYTNRAAGPLREQKLTETFGESAEPLCWPDPEADLDEVIVTLEEFLERWAAGTYVFLGSGKNWRRLKGETELTYEIPAAPMSVDFNGSVISWSAGNDLGNCATSGELDSLVNEGVLPVHPENVVVDEWEIVLEPDLEDGDPTSSLIFTIRVAGDIEPKAVTVPADYLASLPDDTPVKIEVGAIGGEHNATFTEEVGFCVNEVEGCEAEE